MGRLVTTINPANQTKLQQFPYLNAQEVKTRLAATREAKQLLASMESTERAALLCALAQVLLRRKEALARVAADEMGKPLQQGLAEVEKCALSLEYYALEAVGALRTQDVTLGKKRAQVSICPLGTVLGIMPWNFPYRQTIRFLAPAIALGNPAVIKPADNTAGCAMALADAMRDAGWHPGYAQTMLLTHEDTLQLMASEAIQAVTLTGSERAGRAVAAAAGAHLKKCVLELGGSDAYLILEDADIELAAKIGAQARLINSGQSCIAAKRFITVGSTHQPFVEALAKAMASYQLGDPHEPASQIGPLAKAAIHDEVTRQVSASLAQGARSIYQSPKPQGPGNWQAVTVLDAVRPGMPVFDEEVFGPVAAVIHAASEDQALTLANQTRFGLGGAIFSRNHARAIDLAQRRLEVGVAAINEMVYSDPRLPFGGIKSSGFGRELGHFGLWEFANIKTLLLG